MTFMKISNFPTSCCRHCQHYQIEGRRGGHCTLLSVPVRGEWNSCSLGVAAFASARVAVESMAEAEIAETAKAKVSDSLTFNNSQLDLANTEKSLTNPILTIA